MDIALAADERFFPGLWGTVISMLSHAPVATGIQLHIIDCGISSASWDLLETTVRSHPYPPNLLRRDFPRDCLKGLYLPPGKSEVAYARLFFPDIFDCDELLYLDSDLLVFRDILELGKVDISQSAGAAVLNEDGDTLGFDVDLETCQELGVDPDSKYYNTGLFLMNLQFWRDLDLTNLCLEYLDGRQATYVDQTAINAVMNKQIISLDPEWNRLINHVQPSSFANPNCVLHYTNEKPWIVKQVTPAAKLFEKFCIDTGLNWVEPPSQETIWERFEVLNLPRSWAYGMLGSWHRFRGNHDRSLAYENVAGYWKEWFAQRGQRNEDYQLAAIEIDNRNYRPEWLK